MSKSNTNGESLFPSSKQGKENRKLCRKKGLIYKHKRSYGRDFSGHISSRYKSAGHKSLYRKVSFVRRILDTPGTVKSIEYDPNRTSFIALIEYQDSRLEYIIAPQKLSVGDEVIASEKSISDFKSGFAVPIRLIPKGVAVHNVELKPGAGGKMARSAGSYVTIIDKNDKHAILQMPSGETRAVRVDCFATIGAVSNSDHSNKIIAKAGRSRWLGIRPHVRGVAKNPVDHPHGGGEGKTASGRHPVTPWGKKTKGLKTRKRKMSSSLIIKKRKKN